MTITDKLPNLSKSFEKMKLILDLEQRVNQNTMIGQAILTAIRGGQYSQDEILGYVRDQALDSFKTMADAISPELTQRIINYKP